MINKAVSFTLTKAVGKEVIEIREWIFISTYQ